MSDQSLVELQVKSNAIEQRRRNYPKSSCCKITKSNIKLLQILINMFLAVSSSANKQKQAHVPSITPPNLVIPAQYQAMRRRRNFEPRGMSPK